MKYYEHLDPIDQKKLVLRTVAFSSYLEGMDEAVTYCQEELRKLESLEEVGLDSTEKSKKSG